MLIATIKGVLGERVSEVRASNRLVDSAACLVASGQGPDRELQRLLSLKSTASAANRSWKSTPAIPWSRVFPRPNSRQCRLADLCELLFDQALILDGDVPDDPAAFTKRMNRFVVRGLPPPIKAPSTAG